MEQKAAIGKIINTHGVRGGLKVQMLSDFPERVKLLERVFVEKKGQSKPYRVLEAKIHGRFWLLWLEGIADLDAAKEQVGALITIPLSERVKLPPDTYYLDQIMGLEVFTVSGEFLGQVKEIIQTGSNDVYVVAADDLPEILIPALKSVVKDIDLEAGRMEVDLPEGLR
ncbi:MAG: 16S rRNA processing protein RimM [Firmicutes bacterium]|nr:16S rRNA processing protein RimM [Bacillota bacterium]